MRGKDLHEASSVPGNFHGRERVFRLILIVDLIHPPINRLQGGDHVGFAYRIGGKPVGGKFPAA